MRGAESHKPTTYLGVCQAHALIAYQVGVVRDGGRRVPLVVFVEGVVLILYHI